MSRADDEQPGGSWLHFYGEELKTTREAAGMSLRGLASHTTYSFQQVSNVEAARRTPSQAFSREVDAALGTGDRFQRILRRVLQDPYPDWFKGAAEEEKLAALLRPVGGRDVVVEQLQRLVREAESPNVVLQIVPLRTNNHPGLDGPFTIWGYEERDDVMYTESMLAGQIIEEREDVAAAHLAYDPLQAVALDPGTSLGFIRSVVKDEYSA
jgi:transcriptional regulator with XRE-family HTH domain